MKNDQQLRQRFALVHDGSNQGWQAAYLAIHVAARLGAPLQVWLTDSSTDTEALAQRAAQLEIGGRAAGVTLETQIVRDFSLRTFAHWDITSLNGMFFPHRLLAGDDAAARLLGGLSCPVWIVANEPKTLTMAVLVDDPIGDRELILYAALMSQRMSEAITGLAVNTMPLEKLEAAAELAWFSLHDFSSPAILSALEQLHVDLLFLGLANFSLVRSLKCTCIVYPDVKSP